MELVCYLLLIMIFLAGIGISIFAREILKHVEKCSRLVKTVSYGMVILGAILPVASFCFLLFLHNENLTEDNQKQLTTVISLLTIIIGITTIVLSGIIYNRCKKINNYNSKICGLIGFGLIVFGGISLFYQSKRGKIDKQQLMQIEDVQKKEYLDNITKKVNEQLESFGKTSRDRSKRRKIIVKLDELYEFERKLTKGLLINEKDLKKILNEEEVKPAVPAVSTGK